MDSKALVKINGGASLAIADVTFGGAVGPKGNLLGVRRFIATAAGLSETLVKGKTFKEVKALVHDDAKVKSLQKQYDQGRQDFYRASKQIAALAAADPSMRAETRMVIGKNGPIGVNVKHRWVRESAAAQSKNEQIAALQAQVERLTKLTATFLEATTEFPEQIPGAFPTKVS